MDKVKLKKIWDYWYEEWIKPLIIAIVLALIIRTFIIQPFKIPSGSMRPTLIEGDRIFVSKFIYGARIPFTNKRIFTVRAPARGDVMVFESPLDPDKDFIKRVIGLPGEGIEIADGKIKIDGEIVEEPSFIHNNFYYNRSVFGKEGEAFEVPQNSYYVLGDNSASSRDSRYWGIVPKDNIIGRAFFIFWPPKRVKILRNN